MLRLQAYRFQIEPNGEQLRDLRRFAGSCRFVYNKALGMQKALYEQGEKKLGYAGLCKSLVEWKGQPELDWLSETPSQALQQTLKDLERGYANFFAKRADFPLGLKADKPLAAVARYGDVFHRSQHIPAVSIANPAEFRQEDPGIPLVNLELLRVGVAETVAPAFFLGAGKVSAFFKEVLVGSFRILGSLLQRMNRGILQPGRFRTVAPFGDELAQTRIT